MQIIFTALVVTRSSAQGNRSAKSLAATVMWSILPYPLILPYPRCFPPVMLSTGRGSCLQWRVPPGGPASGGWSGLGTFQSSCHTLHYHMVLHPKGTSHNKFLVLPYLADFPDRTFFFSEVFVHSSQFSMQVQCLWANS